ncbi:MAG TPA: hypothetical protein VFQ61_03535 [Polyangiaceae bacterium]|nr:hypothetical protein [Polyangiaceae bacterium]
MDSQRWIAVLRGTSQLAVIDESGRELSRRAGPRGAVGCAVTREGQLLVIGEQADSLWVFRTHVVERASSTHERNSLTIELGSPTTVELPGALRPRALAVEGRTAFVADADAHLLFELDLASTTPRIVQRRETCREPIALETTSRHLVINCLADHRLVFLGLSAHGRVRSPLTSIEHDGPFWALSLLPLNDELWVAASGVEDHPLQRFEGAFGYVDSFVYVYRVVGRAAQRIHALNVSESHVLVPKALRWIARGSVHELWVTGYGSVNWLLYSFSNLLDPPNSKGFEGVPGLVALEPLSAGAWLGASSLLDAWVRADTEPVFRVRVQPVAGASEQTPSARLGEALFFTELMAPRADSTGHRSRFTCETCHFEAGTDGRVHHTGRGEVRVSTRPLLGLLENAPHFSRALDRDLTQVAHNEFRVASLGTPQNPWFSTSVERVPWLTWLGALPADLSPELLRQGLLEFLAGLEPAPNSHVANALAHGRSSFTSIEAAGAEVFARRCVGCHAARLFSDEPDSEVPFGTWSQWIFRDDGPVVWARGDYEKTAVLPYVHELGTRIPSLRRVDRKYPYFTNGSAHSLQSLLESFAWTRERSFHANAPAEAARLDPGERTALLAFLRLL